MFVYYPQDIVLTFLYTAESKYYVNFGQNIINATRHNGNYRITSSPREACGLAISDVVKVAYEDGDCYITEVVEESGYSSVFINDFNEKDYHTKEVLKNNFKAEFETAYDGDYPRRLLINIPPHVDYGPIKAYLDLRRKNYTLHFRELCIRKHHHLQSRPMCPATFWELIRTSHKENRDLVSMLTAFSPLNIIEFEKVLDMLIHDIDTFRLRAALKMIKGSASDEQYLHFRCWIVERGEKFYREVLQHTDHLAHYCLKYNSLEKVDLLYVAREAYEQKTGKPLKGHLSGDDFDLGEEDYPTLFPRLWQKYRA